MEKSLGFSTIYQVLLSETDKMKQHEINEACVTHGTWEMYTKF